MATSVKKNPATAKVARPVRHRTPAKKAAPARTANATPPPGYTPNNMGVLLVPQDYAATKVTPASKLKEGMAKARYEIRESLHELAATLTMDFEISEIELAISFSAEGKFLGFGIGGATSIKVKIKPAPQPSSEAA